MCGFPFFCFVQGQKEIDQKKSRSNCCGLSISDGLHSLSGQLRKRQNRKRITRLEAAVRPRSPTTMTDHSVQTRLPVRVYQQVPPKAGHPKQGGDWSKTVTDKGNNPPKACTSCNLCGERVETTMLKVHEANCRKVRSDISLCYFLRLFKNVSAGDFQIQSIVVFFADD